MASNAIAKQQRQPHALMFPFPGPGHINPMLQLAKRMLHQGFFITFVNTEYYHERMFSKKLATDMGIANLTFLHIPDGLPEGHQRSNQKPNGVVEKIVAVLALPGPLAKLVRRVVEENESPPLTCIISDSFCSWVQEVADQFQIPRVSLWTTPVHANIAFTSQSALESLGLIPVPDKSKLQEVVDHIAGIVPMKLEDYISFFLTDSTNDTLYQWFLRLCMKRPHEAIWNLGNNFEELEQEACDAFKKEVSNFLPIGPLLPADDLRNENQNLQNDGSTFAAITSLTWPEDAMCNEWLSQHKRASVIYISFGSIAHMSEEDVGELILGLEESQAPFVWSVRNDQTSGAMSRLCEMLHAEAVRGKPSPRGLIVEWAAQFPILTHPSIGLFLCHCGWNSITESIGAGVPILAKPGGFAEQRMNAHYVVDVWKIGHRLPEGASASGVKKMINSLLGSSFEAASMHRRLHDLRQSALGSLLPPGGSSFSNFKLFIDDLNKRAAAVQLPCNA